MIEYKNGDLFSAPENEYLLHACNCMGVWGGGVALEFRNRFPNEFQNYKRDCMLYGKDFLGHATLIGRIVCLFTSYGYGYNKDSELTILDNTRKSLIVLTKLTELMGKNIHINSPLINAGLFAVPWEKTESIINNWLKSNPNVEWVVWKL